jgi:cell division protein FtsI/penicillin-binding protein 2
LVVATVVVVLRASQVMILEAATWEQKARSQQQRVISVPGRRGQIVSSDGYVLAGSVDRVAVQLNTAALRYPELFVDVAAPLLGTTAAELLQRVTDGPRAIWLAQRLDQETAEAIRALAPAAVVVVPDSDRFYPLGRLAAPVVGFVGREELTTVGRVGLEQAYDEFLAGAPDEYLAVRDAVQRQLRLERLRAGRPGFDLELTLHARLQAVTQKVLEDAVEKLGAKSAAAVVLDPRTGALLALGSAPSFDPSSPGRITPDQWRLHPVQDAWEPGSTVKPIVAAAALGFGAVRPGERFDCSRRGIMLAGRWIRDHASPGYYSLDEIVVESANAGIVMVAERMTPEELRGAFSAFGFGEVTAVGFPGEMTGLLLPVSRWSRLSKSGLALGQELTVTPLQMAVAYAAFANGGWLAHPTLVRRATSSDRSLPTPPQWRRRVMDAALAERVRSMLEGVVKDGTGKMAQVPGYRVAGKTGTAQQAVDGRFDDQHHVAWFAGFLPNPDPQAVVVVAVEQPTTTFWASQTAAPAFSAIAGAAASLLELPSTPEDETEKGGTSA